MAKWDLIQEQLPKIQEMAQNGNTETEIIEYLKIGRKTFYKYKKEHQELQEALAEGYRTSLKNVEAALYKIALGYQYDEITCERNRDGEMIETKRVTKEVQPNASAIMNILKNKAPATWNIAEKIDIKGEISQKSLPDLPTKKVAELARLLIEEGDEKDEN